MIKVVIRIALESEVVRKIKAMLSGSNSNHDIIQYIKNNILYVSYDMLLAQKIILKVYESVLLSEHQKSCIYEIIRCNYESRKDEIQLHIMFLYKMIPVVNKIKAGIENEIRNNFSDSLFTFLYILGMYLYENPDMISYPRKMLIDIAINSLNNDVEWKDVQNKILLAYSMYYKNRILIDNIYKEAIKCGCIIEKYNDISYFKERVTKIEEINQKVYVNMVLSNAEYQIGLQMGCIYNTDVFLTQLSNEKQKPGMVHKHYQCFICKKICFIGNQNYELRELMFDYINRQFSQISSTDKILFFTVTLSSIIFSIILYLYVELLILILTSEESYKVIKMDEIRKNMCFGDDISDDEFHSCINSIFPAGEHMVDFYSENPFFRRGNTIIIAKWMYNHNFSIVEETRNIFFNTRKNSELGKSADYFGKSIFEGIVKWIMSKYGWKALESSLKVKRTDFDLVVYKNGVIILGQIKVAHTGRENYQIWKADKIIEQGIKQINECRKAVAENKNLLYSNLKREKIVQKREDIKKVIYLVVTSSSYFSRNNANIPIISIDDLKSALESCSGDTQKFVNAINNPFERYDYENLLIHEISRINTEEFYIEYEEIDF